jgi:hypothetical protein
MTSREQLVRRRRSERCHRVDHEGSVAALRPKFSCKRSTTHAAHLLACGTDAMGGNRNASTTLALVGCNATLDGCFEKPIGGLPEPSNIRVRQFSRNRANALNERAAHCLNLIVLKAHC